ncbi:IS630 family transposase [Dactylosporangium fulvum]|uniref:IS630 family transposase n=2 Tax=Dactylosporangium fulvum TaxID=53359 RepID=A0ABY5WCQ4_9ACTN|nr:IS630 family transposase [Dactylosporangium fulvum]UWP83082.1 IS630 family transposase [Dactylosporangium fulvum]UWP87195.1 IS630 family transposase [Dactylosporangium fulvum]
MRPVCVFAEVSGGTRAQIMDLLHGRWRTATRLIMVVLSTAGMPPAQIAALLDYHPATVRRWLHRYRTEGIPGLPDRPRPGRPRLGGTALTTRITALLTAPGPWTIRRLWQHLGRPAISPRTLWRYTRTVAHWRRPRLIARGDPDHNHTLAGIRRRIARLPAGSVVIAEDEAHLDLLPAVRATWTLRGHRHHVMTPGKNRRATIFGALDLTTGTWWYLWARRRATGFIAMLQLLLTAYPNAPAVAVICDNDGIHHAAAVRRWVSDHPRLRLIHAAAYSPHDNPVERIWASLKADLANTAVTWIERIHQARVFFRRRTPDQMLTTAAPWTSPWLPHSYAQNFREPA